jgi:hypothetical protein
MPGDVNPKKLQRVKPGWLARSFERAEAAAKADPEYYARLRANWADR